MGNTDDKKDIELKKIPRNPNIPIKDDEVEALLKKAAEQVLEKEKKVKMKPADAKTTNAKPEEKKPTHVKPSEKKTAKKPEEKISASKDADRIPQFKKKNPDEARENIALQRDHKDVGQDKKPSGDKPALDFKVEDDVYVTKKLEEKAPIKSDKMSAGDVIGSVFEGVWTGIKLIVLVTLVTAVVGFFMSRDLMIRGRSGEMVSKQNMNVAPVALSNETEEKEAGRTWSQTAKMEKLTLEADDGKILVAQKVVVNKDSDNWVVVLHGQNGKVEDIYDIGLHYAQEGYNVLMPDLRAHGESEGSFYGMGWLDRLDVINWIDVILEDNPSANVILHGIDLGADAALMLSGEPLKDSIKAIVAEGAYTTAWDVTKTEYKARHENWPVFPLLHMMNPVMKVWAGYSLKEADAVEQVKKTDVPILLIRGGNDTYVTENMTKKLDQAIASEHEVLTIATGTHEDCRFAEPDNYYNKVFEFAEKYMK